VTPIMVIAFITAAIFLLLIFGSPFKPIQFVGQGLVKIVIGALFLFFVNVFGVPFDIHIPINIITAAISGLLGLPGIGALIAIKFLIL
jgi:inhibitor of the pro-sigma K processing machinery